MEYGESSFNGGITYQHKCQSCGHSKHNVKGGISYSYLFLQSLPLFPTGRHVQLECTNCLQLVGKAEIDKALYQQLLGSAFTIYHYLVKFIGTFLLCYFIYLWIQALETERNQTQHIVNAPQINDFMLFDNRQLTDAYRPHEKYRIGKVVDVTGDTISLVLGNMVYSHKSSFRDAIASGQTRAFSYFGKKHHHFQIDDLQQLHRRDGVLIAARPDGNVLYGNFIINDIGYRLSASYIPGEREYASGLAYEQASYIQDHMVEAFVKFEKSAQLGFSEGQIKLAEIYLAGELVKPDFSLALFWLEQASFNSYERAIKKYAIVCEQTKDCDLPAFYQRLIDHGVNLYQLD